jgi:sec-independent protein translocase protein TatB
VFNIGFGEMLLIAVLGLLVFGPDKLPDAMRRGSQALRQIRQFAADARKQVSDAAGIDDAEAARVVSDLRDLHPKRIAASVLDPLPEPDQQQVKRSKSTGIDPGAM